MRPLPLRLAYRIAGWVAVVCQQTVFRGQSQALRANLQRVLPHADDRRIEQTARASFRQFGKFVIDFIHYPVMTTDEVKRRLRFDQWGELDELASSGRGVVLVTLHFGAWDLGGAALASRGHKISAVAETFDYPPMNELIQGSRVRLGMRVLPRERAGIHALRALRAGEMLAMLIDVTDGDAGTVYVDFFGAPAVVSSAPARLALRTDAWVVPAVVLRGPDDDLDIRPYIDMSLRDFAPSGAVERDVEALTALIMRSLEARVREHPEQWFMFRRLWADPLPAARPATAAERPT
jgi:KDO2-lipid IV(A) lauroyltransferase